MLGEDRFFCEVCERRYGVPGDCPSCPQEPLLDLDDETVQRFLIHQDESRARRRYSLYIGIGIVPAIATAVPAMYVAGDAAALVLAAFVAMGVAALLGKLFPAPKKNPLGS